MEKEDGYRHHAGSGRDRQPYKSFTLDSLNLHIEPCQSQGSAGYKQKCRQPAESAERFQRPEVHQKTGGNTERHQISKGVILNPELAGRTGSPCHLAVQTVADQRTEYPDSSCPVIAIHPGNHAVESGEQTAGCKQVREDVYPLTHAF